MRRPHPTAGIPARALRLVLERNEIPGGFHDSSLVRGCDNLASTVRDRSLTPRRHLPTARRAIRQTSRRAVQDPWPAKLSADTGREKHRFGRPGDLDSRSAHQLILKAGQSRPVQRPRRVRVGNVKGPAPEPGMQTEPGRQVNRQRVGRVDVELGDDTKGPAPGVGQPGPCVATKSTRKGLPLSGAAGSLRGDEVDTKGPAPGVGQPGPCVATKSTRKGLPLEWGSRVPAWRRSRHERACPNL